jgi:hypothetical protein
MARYPDDRLRRLRNDIIWKRLLEHWRWPHKMRAGQLAFQCPRCRELIAVVNPRTNLGRCFSCEVNFNPIDFTMEALAYDFVETVERLMPLLPPREPA